MRHGCRRTRVAVVAAGVLGPAALPSVAVARSLRGSVGFSGFSGKFRGWNVLVFGTVGATGGGSNDLTISLGKTRTRRVSEGHEWSLNLPAGTVRLNRSRASIAVNYSLGARGRISFRLSGAAAPDRVRLQPPQRAPRHAARRHPREGRRPVQDDQDQAPARRRVRRSAASGTSA